MQWRLRCTRQTKNLQTLQLSAQKHHLQAHGTPERRQLDPVFTCTHALEILIVRPLSRKHDPRTLIFKRSPGKVRKDRALLRIIPSHVRLIRRQRRYPRVTPTSPEQKVAAVCQPSRQCYPSEYETKEITSALLCVITAVGHRSDRIRSQAALNSDF